MTAAVSAVRAPTVSARDVLVTTLALLLLPIGVWLVPQVLNGAQHASRTAVQASFGDVTVAHVGRSAGVSDQALGGMSHGVPGLVHANQELVVVELQLAGRSGEHRFGATQFSLVADGGKPRGAVAGTLGTGRLDEGTTIEGSLGFVVPRGARSLVLQVTGGGDTQRLDLSGLPGAAPRRGIDEDSTGSTDQHQH
jgi:hypothetical protein